MKRFLVDLQDSRFTEASEQSKGECSLIRDENSEIGEENLDILEEGSVIMGESSRESNSTKDKRRRYSHKFNENWLQQFPWLSRNEKNKGFCKCCFLTIVGSITHFKRHEESKKHQEKYQKAISLPKINKYIVENEKRIVHDERVYSSELKMVMFLNEHNLPFLLADHLVKLLPSLCPDSLIAKDMNCGRTKATAITNECLAKESLMTLKHNLASNPMYSLIIDETTDVSMKKSLAVVMRFFNKNTVNDKFLGLLEVSSADAQSLFDGIIKLLNDNEIPVMNMLGFAADNASVMMGNKNGVQKKFKELNKDVFVLGCTCHSIHLCSSAAATKLPKSVEEFVRHLYNHFSNSPKRVQNFEEFQAFLSLEPHKMLRPSQTRWLSLQAVVDRTLLMWDALGLYFRNYIFETEEKAILHTDRTILDNLNNPIFKVYLLFLSYILEIVNQMNLQFQSETTQIHTLYTKFTSLYKTVLKNFVLKSVIEKKNCELLEISPNNPENYMKLEDMYMGAELALFLYENNIPAGELNKVRVNVLHFYVELCNQIRKRFNFEDDFLKYLTNFQPQVAISGDVPTIFEASRYFKGLGINLEKLDYEWRLLPEIEEFKIKNTCQSNKSGEFDKNGKTGINDKLNFDYFWKRIFKMENELEEAMFPNLTKIIKAVMCLPHSSAAAERVFSKLNLVKTKTRNKLKVETCNSILLAADLFNNESCYTWQPSQRLLQNKPKYNSEHEKTC